MPVEAVMRALRWHGQRDLRLDDVAAPGDPVAGQAVLAVAYCGVCGTDLHEYAAGPQIIRTGPHPLTGHTPPVTLGHEFAGTVVAVGPDVTGVAVGDRVVADPCWRCGVCRWCTRGEYHLCPRGGSVGLASDGALAERVVVPAAGLVRLPDEVPFDVAAVAEPLAVGLHAVTRGGVCPGDNVLILGGGPIGVAALLAARLAGAAEIIVSEPVAARRERLLPLGASAAFDPTMDDVRRETFLRTHRVGPDVVVEATGRPELAVQALSTVRRGGRVVVAGIADQPARLDLTQLVLYERTLSGSLGYNFDIDRVVALIAAGRLDAAAMITARRPLSEGVATFDELLADKGRHLKILLTPEE